MAAADKVSGAYWRKHAIELAEKQKQEDDDLCLRFHREYERILHELDKELSIFYARYAANEKRQHGRRTQAAAGCRARGLPDVAGRVPG